MELVVKYFHELLMFMAITISMGSSIHLRRIAKSGHVPTIRRVFDSARPFMMAISPLFGVGTLFGLWAAWAAGIPLLSLWLVCSYILTIVAASLGHVSKHWGQNVGRLAYQQTTGDDPGPELTKVLLAPFPAAVFWVDLVILVLFLILMVFRPTL